MRLGPEYGEEGICHMKQCYLVFGTPYPLLGFDSLLIVPLWRKNS